MRNQSGFTLIEAMIVIAVIGIMTAVAVASSLSYLPDMRLKSASRDLYSNLQKAKMMAVKTNTSHAVFFDTANNLYQIIDLGPDGTLGTIDDLPQAPIFLSNYKSYIGYGYGNATIPANPDGVFPGNGVSFNDPTDLDTVIFNSRGMLLNVGFIGNVYLSNNTTNNRPIIERSSFVVGVPVVTGIIRMSKWYNGSNSWD